MIHGIAYKTSFAQWRMARQMILENSSSTSLSLLSDKIFSKNQFRWLFKHLKVNMTN